MKKIRKILLITVMEIIFFTMMLETESMAAEQIISLTGKSEIDKKQINTMMITVNSSDAIGAMEGVISYDANIESIKLSSTEEGWNLTNNEETGKFNTYKAEGTKNGDIIKIEYNLKEGAKEGTITMSNVQVVTTSYETQTIEEIKKTVKEKTTDINYEDNKAPESLPYTGASMKLFIVFMIGTSMIAVIMYKKIRIYKGI